jgi:thioredoxin reductase (NADPH)
VVWRVVGQQWSPRSHELRDLLDRNAIPYQFLPHDSEAGRELLRETGQDDTRLPVLVLFDGQVLVDPTNAAAAAAIGVATRPDPGRYDLIVVGAGPAGLPAATYGASEGLRTLMVEPEALGGQAGTTFLIRNYLGFPRGVSGRDLALRASQQAMLFGASLTYARAVGLRPAGQDRVVTLADGSQAGRPDGDHRHRRHLPTSGRTRRRRVRRRRRVLRRGGQRSPGDDRHPGLRGRRRQLGRPDRHPSRQIR